MKRIVCLMIALMLMLPFAAAAAETISVAYTYTFEPGNALEGEGTEAITGLLNAIRIRMVRQNGETDKLYRIELISEGKVAFNLMAQDTADGEYALACSLLGNNQLRCRKEQMTSFLQTIVKVLADLNVLKGESLEKIDRLAVRAGNMLTRLENTTGDDMSLDGIDLTPFLRALNRYASNAEERALASDNTECPGAVKAQHYQLTEEDLNGLIEYVLGKVKAIPVIQEELASGRLYIGKQQITDTFIRQFFAAMHGETTMDLYEDEQDQIVRMEIGFPDLKGLAESPELDGLVTDPDFLNWSGISIQIDRVRGEGVALSSRTSIHLMGLETDLVAITLERTEGEPLEMPKAKKVHTVGELDSAEMWKLLKSMGNTIAWNGIDFILDLPEVVFKLIASKFSLFK
ncbi:MAG: hypothetical protein IJG94_06630 [Clostridia bacterium]|nr:hypothetical protein [Clostridia bacterium]